MATNAELTKQLALELGVEFVSRRPYAREIFKYYNIDLLSNSAEDTLVGELFDFYVRDWRTTHNNIVGLITTDTLRLTNELKAMPKINAQVPDFEFSKEDIVDAGFKIPALFNLRFSGAVRNAKKLTVKVNGIKRARLTNYEAPGIEISNLLSVFARDNSKEYRQKIKNDYVVKALFYADSFEIELEKEVGVEIEIGFDINAVNVEVGTDTETKKHYVIRYKDMHQAPFGANFVKGKNLF